MLSNSPGLSPLAISAPFSLWFASKPRTLYCCGEPGLDSPMKKTGMRVNIACWESLALKPVVGIDGVLCHLFCKTCRPLLALITTNLLSIQKNKKS